MMAEAQVPDHLGIKMALPVSGFTSTHNHLEDTLKSDDIVITTLKIRN